MINKILIAAFKKNVCIKFKFYVIMYFPVIGYQIESIIS